MVTAGGASWKEAAFPEAAHTDETKRTNLQTLRTHALSRKNMARHPLRISSQAAARDDRWSKDAMRQRMTGTTSPMLL